MPTLAELTADPRNARRHDRRNVEAVRDAIARDGFGRSLLLANDGTIIAGNATRDAAAEADLADVLVVETDGTRAIAVKRTDVAPGSPAFHRLAVADNRSAELASWDGPVLLGLQEDELLALDDYWTVDELPALLARPTVPIPAALPDGDPRADAFVEIWCSGDDLTLFRPTLDAWGARRGVTINIA